MSQGCADAATESCAPCGWAALCISCPPPVNYSLGAHPPNLLSGKPRCLRGETFDDLRRSRSRRPRASKGGTRKLARLCRRHCFLSALRGHSCATPRRWSASQGFSPIQLRDDRRGSDVGPIEAAPILFDGCAFARHASLEHSAGAPPCLAATALALTVPSLLRQPGPTQTVGKAL